MAYNLLSKFSSVVLTLILIYISNVRSVRGSRSSFFNSFFFGGGGLKGTNDNMFDSTKYISCHKDTTKSILEFRKKNWLAAEC